MIHRDTPFWALDGQVSRMALRLGGTAAASQDLTGRVFAWALVSEAGVTLAEGSATVGLDATHGWLAVAELDPAAAASVLALSRRTVGRCRHYFVERVAGGYYAYVGGGFSVEAGPALAGSFSITAFAPVWLFSALATGQVVEEGLVALAGPPALAALSLSNSAIAANAVAGDLVGAFIGKTSGSTLSLVDDAGGAFALSGSTLVAGATPRTTEGAIDITVRETLAGATGSPRDTVLTLTVVAVTATWDSQDVRFDSNHFTWDAA